MILSLLLDFLFPSHCVSCSRVVLAEDNNLCIKCLSSLKLIEDGCPRCSGFVVNGDCMLCTDRYFYPELNILLFENEGAAKDVISAFKFGGAKNLCTVIIPFLMEKANHLMSDIDIISYVPMNREKLKKRGYNQSELIASAAGLETGKNVVPLLEEQKKAGVQKDLNYNERFINVIDRYKIIENSRISNKKILLIDDVFTTGATLNECARILKQGGAESVITCAVLRSDMRKGDTV